MQLKSTVSVSGLGDISRMHLTDSLSGETHDFQELIYVENGSLTISIQGESCLLKAGELLVLRPHAYHTLQGQAQLIRIPFCCHSPAIPEHIFPAEETCLSMILQEAENQTFGWEQMVKNALEQLLILCLRHGGTDWRDRTVSANLLHQHAWLVHQVKAYLHGHFAERITLELLAALHDISVTQLKRIFKAQTGTTIIAYLTDYRITKAKELIREGRLNFTQIAEAVGYDNIYYFSTQFKKQTGMTPTAYSRGTPVHL